MSWSTPEQFLAYVRAVPDGSLFPVVEVGGTQEEIDEANSRIQEQESLVQSWLEFANRQLRVNENYNFPEEPEAEMLQGEQEYALYLFKNESNDRQDLINNGVSSFRIGNFSETFIDSVKEKELWGSTLPSIVQSILKKYFIQRRLSLEVVRNPCASVR